MDSSTKYDKSFEQQFQVESQLDVGGCVFKCRRISNKKPFALKKIGLDSSTEDWKSVIELRNENVVTYHCCYVIRDSFRYLVMDLCWASMTDFCLGRLVVSHVEIDRLIGEAAHGLDFLHRNNIIHGRLGLGDILLWRKRPNLKPIVKISGYYPLIRSIKPQINDDLEALGRIFYSMAASDVNPPKKVPVSSTELSLISFNQRKSASEMINLLLSPKSEDLKPTSVKALLLNQSFFKTCTATAEDRIRDVKELDDFNKLTKGLFKEDDVNSLKQSMRESLVAAEDVDEFVTKAIEQHPKLFAEFVWDLSSYPPLEKSTFVQSSTLGSGAAGIVLAGKWMKEDQEEMAVACKRFYRHKNGIDKFYKEYEALRQLDHLFVVKCFGTCEIEFDKCIIMELCEGTLQNYVLRGLERIAKDSLDDKIILGQVTLGLAYIHSKEMIHKDLKPANILLWSSSGRESLVVAKLADFDFAKQLKTARGEFSGTYRPGTRGYMAPELLTAISQQQEKKCQQMRKVFATVDSDAYALGITIAFTVLKGKHPFGNPFTRDVMMKSGADPILLGDLEWDVTDLILRLTRKDPKERPIVSFLIYHPYFVLANEKSKAHFAEKVDDYFNLFPSPYQARMTYVNRRKIEEWMQIITSQTEREANVEMKKWLNQTNESLLQETRLHLDNSQEYYEKIKREIQRDNENDINKTFHSDASKSQSMMDYFRDWTLWTRRLIESAPRFSVSYFWYLINDRPIFEDPKSKGQVAALFRNYYTNEKNKITPPDILRAVQVFKIEEHVHACLHFKCQEDIEEIWNYKRAGELCVDLCDEQIHRLLREIPSYSTAASIIGKLINKMDNINSYHSNDNTTVLHWLLRNRWEKIDVSVVRDLLEKKANPNMGDKDGTTPVHYAAKNESIEGPTILRFLLLNGGDPNQMNGRERKRTPLHYAAMNESIYAPGILNVLLEFDSKVNVVDKHGFTPLHYAARNKSKESPDILKILLDRGSDPNKTFFRFGMVPPFQRTAVHIATMNETQSGLKMLEILLENGGNPNVYDAYRETPLHYAAKIESNFGPKIMESLLKHEGDLTLATLIHKLPIHFAAENKSTSGRSIMEIILKHGGNPNIVIQGGESVVHLAVQNESESGLEILQLLLDNNGDPNKLTGRYVGSPVHRAATNRFHNSPNVLKLLLDNGGNPYIINADSRTPVHMAAENESDVGPDLLELLLQYKTNDNVNAGDSRKITAVHLAAANKSDSAGSKILEILLRNGADPNAEDENHETPVHYAVKNESSSAPNILQFLLENGGNWNVFNDRNKTPFDLAIENNSESTPKLLELLLDKGFNVNAVNSTGVTSLHLAATNQSNSGPRILTLLLEHGGDCTVVDGDNKMPIHYAAKNESQVAAEMVKILLDKVANPNATSSTGVTPVHIAASNSYSGLSILQLLRDRGAVLDVCDQFGTRPVHLAAQTRKSNTDIMEFLLANGGDLHVNAFDVCRENITKYNMSDQNWRYEELNLSPNRNRKRTPVHYAAESEMCQTKPNVLKLLLKRGGDPNFEDERKRTAVHLAVRNGGLNGPKILKVLLRNNGSIDAVDDQLRTPVHLAALLPSNKFNIMKLLMEYNGNPNAVDSSGRTPLHYAATNNTNIAPQIIELLLAKNGNPNAVDNLGLTPVHCCCVSIVESKTVTVKILELLMKNGGDPDVPDGEGRTAIDLVVNGHSSEMQKILNILKLYSKKPKPYLFEKIQII